MKKKVLTLIFSIGMFGSVYNAYSADSTGCGLGTTLWKGNSGVVPQVLAVTTNGTFANQTFGISSGTLHCDPNGRVTGASSRVFFAFLEGNVDAFALDCAKGEGETINTVADIAKIKPAKAGKILKENFNYLFSDENTDLVVLSEKLDLLLVKNKKGSQNKEPIDELAKKNDNSQNKQPEEKLAGVSKKLQLLINE